MVSKVNNLIDNATAEDKDKSKNQKANLSAPSPWDIKFADGAKVEEAAKSDPYAAPGTNEELTKDAPSGSLAPASVISGDIPDSEDNTVNNGPGSDVIKKNY